MIYINKKTGELHDTKKVNGTLYVVDKNNDSICAVDSEYFDSMFQEAKSLDELDIGLDCRDLDTIMRVLKRAVQFQEAISVPAKHKLHMKIDTDHVIDILNKLNVITGNVCYGHLNGAVTPAWFNEMGPALTRYRSKRK